MWRTSTQRRSRRAMLALPLLLVALCAAVPREARANGRFPNAQQVFVGPGERSDIVVLQVTFGLLISYDGGASFHWLCEDAMYWPIVPGLRNDPSPQIMADGTVVYGFEEGVFSTSRGCFVQRHASVARRHIIDTTTDPAGETVWGIESERALTNHILRARSPALQFSQLGAGIFGMLFTTLDVAPSRPTRLYAAGVDGTNQMPRLYRSDDGGETLTLQAPNFGMATDAYVSGVSATDANVLFVRGNVGMGTVLFRSRDGGATLERVAMTRGPMQGFALSGDGRQVWYGGPEDGLWRSDDGGMTFTQVSTLPVFGLRWHAGVLWACTDWLRQPFALGRSRDGGRTFEAVLQFENIRGAFECMNPSEAQQICEERWPIIRRDLERERIKEGDGGLVTTPPDGSIVAPVDAGRVDGGGIDGGTRMDGGPPRVEPEPTCGCAVPGQSTRPAAGSLALVALALALAWRRRGGRVAS